METRKEEAAPETAVETEETPFTAACLAGNVDLVRSMLTAKADANETNKRGTPPINLSGSKEYIEIARELVLANADVNQTSRSGERAATIAAFEGKTEFLTWLVKEAKADVNLSGTKSGASPLFFASQENHSDNVALLLEAKANVNQPNNVTGATPLTITCDRGHTVVAGLLINAKADVNQANAIKGVRPTTLASRKGYNNILELLINAKADIEEPQERDKTPLQLALRQGKTAATQVLIAHGAHLGNLGKELMDKALQEKDLSLISTLIQRNVEIDNIQALQDFLAAEKQQKDSRILPCLEKLSALKKSQAMKLAAESHELKSMEMEVKKIDDYRHKLSCFHSAGQTFLISLMTDTPLAVRTLQDIVLAYVDGFFSLPIQVNFLGSSTVDMMLRITRDSIERRQAVKPGFFDKTVAEINQALNLGKEVPDKSNSAPKANPPH